MTAPTEKEGLLLAAIVDSCDDAILGQTLDGVITSWNAGAERIFGYTAAEVIGEPVNLLIPADRLQEEREVIGLLGEGQQREFFRTVRLHKDGHPIDVSVTVSPIRDWSGTTVGASTVARDMRGRMAVEAEAARATAEAGRANQAKSEFLSRVSHELRTPLNVILGFGQLLQLEPLEPHQKESTDHILKAARHLLDLIDELLDISRIDSDHLGLAVEPLPVDELFSDVLSLLSPVAAERRVTFESRPGQCGMLVMADRRRLRQVLLNLVSNGIKYNIEGGCVSVSCEAVDDGWLRLVVSDTGIGISPIQLERLFSPFDRLGAEATLVQGTGLGLSLSKGLAEAMGGHIGVQSVAGQGSTFWVDLRRAPPLDAGGDDTEYADLLASPPAGVGQKTVLYIEDNSSNLKLVETILARCPGVRLVPAVQGRLGLDLAREYRPDVILLDLHLPDLTGGEIFRQLRMDARTAAIPVVIVTADATSGEVEQLLEAGARAYLAKPLDVHGFLGLIREIIGGPEA